NLTPGDAVLDFLGHHIDLAVNRAVRAAALLWGHELGVINGSIKVIEAFFDIALETRWQGTILIKCVADTLGAGHDRSAVASERSELIGSDTRDCCAALRELLASGDNRSVEQRQRQSSGSARRAGVAFDVIGIKAARAQLFQFGLSKLKLMLATLLSPFSSDLTSCFS